MDSLAIGSSTTLTFKFSNNPVFPVAPEFNVILSNDQVLLSGTSVLSGSVTNGWDVTVTIPSTYQTKSGGETVTVEVYGTDSKGTVRSLETEYRVLDSSDDFSPRGVMVIGEQPIRDTLILDKSNYSSELMVTVYDWEDNILLPAINPTISKVQRVADRNELPDRFSTPKFSGYKYNITLPNTITFPPLTRAACQLHYSLTLSGEVAKYEVHPLYRLTPRWMMHLVSLRDFLDKSRLVEIDPTLQWQDDELCQALVEGCNYINAYPDMVTYWTVEDMPQPMHLPLWYAAAYHALNARYLAEGLTAFDFTGLSTSLNVDRRETLVYKIEEIKSFLETNLGKIKKMVAAVSGVGKIPENASTTPKPIGVLGLNASPASNIIFTGLGNRWRNSFGNY